jgi:hypothetical protein
MFLFTDKNKSTCLPEGETKLVLRFRSIFILTNLEITKFISLLVRCNYMKLITKIILLKVFLSKVFQIPFRELFFRNNCDFVFEALNVNSISRITGFSINFILLPKKLFLL